MAKHVPASGQLYKQCTKNMHVSFSTQTGINTERTERVNLTHYSNQFSKGSVTATIDRDKI